MRCLLFAIIILSTIMTACSMTSEDASAIFSHTISNTLKQPSSWYGAFIVKSEKGGTFIHTVYDGEHEGNVYIMSVETQGTGFDAQAEVKKENGELFVKLPSSGIWQQTTPSDLKMLGIDLANSPVEFAEILQGLDLTINPTERRNIYKIIVDKKSDLPILDAVTEITHSGDMIPTNAPEIFIEVENQAVRSLAMYTTYTDGTTLWYEVELSRKERGKDFEENSH